MYDCHYDKADWHVESQPMAHTLMNYEPVYHAYHILYEFKSRKLHM